MARRRLFWHIGPDDPGMAWLAAALADADLCPGVHPAATADDARDVAVDLRHTQREFGRSRDDVDGTWARIENRIWHHKGISLLSTPDLAPADRSAIRLALDGLRGVEVHLVLLTRDEPLRIRASWERALERGATTSFEKYAARVVDLASDHPQALAFRAGNDVDDLIRRWAPTVPAERIHRLAIRDDQESTWATFLAEAGVVGVALPIAEAPAPLTADAADLLRKVNATLEHPSYAESGAARQLVTTGAGDDPAAEAVAEAAREMARLNARIEELETENARLDRKRRKHKRRLKELQNPPEAAA